MKHREDKYYKAICFNGLAILIVTAGLFAFDLPTYVSLGFIICILFFATLIAYQLLMINRKLTQPVSKFWFLSGVLVIFGGASFDIINTIIFSPDLSSEANPVARLLLDSSFPLHFVYIIGIIGQSLLTTISILLWLVFLKSYPNIISNINLNSPLDFLKTLLGGKNAKLIDIIIGKVKPFYFVISLTPMIVGGFFYRWYLGLEWLGIVPISRIVVPIIILITSFILYICVSYKYAKNKLV